MNDEIYCALSGVMANDEDMISEIPQGWIRVTVEKQYINPQWAAIQMVKRGLVESTLLQLPEEHRDMQRMGIEIQVAAQFHGYEEQFEQFITVEEVLHISNPAKSEDVRASWDDLVEMLGIEEDFLGENLVEDQEDDGEDSEVAED